MIDYYIILEYVYMLCYVCKTRLLILIMYQLQYQVHFIWNYI